jgi:hypothetical protein
MYMYIYVYMYIYIYIHIYAYIYASSVDLDYAGYEMGMFYLYLSEIHMYVNDLYIKFLLRITVAHSIPEHSFSIKNTESL